MRLDRSREAPRGRVDDRDRRDQQQRSVGERAEHLDASVTEGAARIGGPRRADRGEQRERHARTTSMHTCAASLVSARLRDTAPPQNSSTATSAVATSASVRRRCIAMVA